MERSNRSVEAKLAAWMKETGSKQWSIGIKIVQWQINTQEHRGIGNEIPYKLLTGQNPRVGISALPMSKALISTLQTESFCPYVS